MEDVKEIRDIVAAINAAWTGGQYDAIAPYVADHVVMAPPGEDTRVLGRDAYIASFRQFAEVATVKTFVPGTPRVDVVGNTAVAVCPFVIAYEMDRETYREQGTDLLVFARPLGQWKIVWRTVTSEPQPPE
jgi:ketosteroid isomerase-like protein